jgi:hypothetical protein
MHPLFERIRKRPGLYLGADNDSFTALCGFITGYQCGFGDGSPKPHAPSVPADACLLPSDFHRFVTEHYGRKFPDGGRGWQHFVREHADSEQAAFRLFFDLLVAYDSTQQPQRA